MTVAKQERQYDRMVMLSRSLDMAVREAVVSLPRVRALVHEVVVVAEQEMWRRKSIGDIALSDRPMRDTMRYVRFLEQAEAGNDTPDLA